MDFLSAMDEVRKGKPVARTKWSPGRYVYIGGTDDGDGDAPALLMRAKDGSRRWTPDPEDTAASDWIVVEKDYEQTHN